MASAGALIQSQINNPANVLQGGVGSEGRLVLILKADLAGYVANGIDTVTALTLAANKCAYVFDGIRQSLSPKWETVKADSGQNQFKHSAEFYLFAYDQVSKNNYGRLAQGRYVAIYENAKQDGNTFEVLGIEVGLEVLTGERSPDDMGGAMKIMLASPEKEWESKLPRTFDAGTGVYATNRTAIDALVFIPTIGASGLSIVTYAAVTPTAIVITGTNFFANDTNTAVLNVSLVNNSNGAIIPFTAALTVTATTITTTTPVAVAANSYKVQVTTKQGVILSAQNIVTT